MTTIEDSLLKWRSDFTELQQQVFDLAKKRLQTKPWYRGVCINDFPTNAAILRDGVEAAVEAVYMETWYYDGQYWSPFSSSRDYYQFRIDDQKRPNPMFISGEVFHGKGTDPTIQSVWLDSSYELEAKSTRQEGKYCSVTTTGDRNFLWSYFGVY